MGCAPSIASGARRSVQVAVALPEDPQAGATNHPIGFLRVDVRPPSRDRHEVGLAETPAGAQANEFKFFCPLCMMYYREVLETTCCRSYVCGFCHADFVMSQAKKKPGYAAGPTAGITVAGAAGDAALDAKCIPKGWACPHCAAESSGASMKQLKRGDVARSYSDSPQTRAAMAQRASAAAPPLESPLRVGDDFTAMARKLKWMDNGAKCGEDEPAQEDCANDGEVQSLGQSMNQSFSHRLIMEPVVESVERLCGERLSSLAEKSQLSQASEAAEQPEQQGGGVSQAVASSVEGAAADDPSAVDGADATEPQLEALAMRIVASALSSAIAAEAESG